MADNVMNTVLQVCATKSNRLPDLAITNGQLIFIQDKHRIAFDFNNQRKFYNQIEELDTDYNRVELANQIDGAFYFVIETAMLWTYRSDWIQLTSAPEEIVFIGTEMPELGCEKTLYVSKTKKEISVWDDYTDSYVVVADRTEIASVSTDDIDLLFK